MFGLQAHQVSLSDQAKKAAKIKADGKEEQKEADYEDEEDPEASMIKKYISDFVRINHTHHKNLFST